MIFHVVAIANNRVIGKDNKLPWHYPTDLKFFKQLTTGSTVIMGRKTYESIGKPLPNRLNFVLSRNSFLSCHSEHSEEFEILRSFNKNGELPQNDGPYFFDSIDEALKLIKTPNAYIIGGSTVFEQTFDQIDGIYLTRIHKDHDGDAFYPEIPEKFHEKSCTKLQEDPLIEVIYYERAPKIPSPSK